MQISTPKHPLVYLAFFSLFSVYFYLFYIVICLWNWHNKHSIEKCMFGHFYNLFQYVDIFIYKVNDSSKVGHYVFWLAFRGPSVENPLRFGRFIAHNLATSAHIFLFFVKVSYFGPWFFCYDVSLCYCSDRSELYLSVPFLVFWLINLLPFKKNGHHTEISFLDKFLALKFWFV